MNHDQLLEACQALLDGRDHPILREYPMVRPDPLCKPAIGPSFFRQAAAIAAEGDEQLILSVLLFRAMYDPSFVLQTRDKAKQPAVARYVPGGRWGGEGKCGPAGMPDGCKVMVVGKFPGMEEVRLGRNFVGPSGDKLQEVALRYFTQAELDDWYVTNACRHPHLGPDFQSDPSADWCKDGKWLVWAEIVLLRPTHLLLLGTQALKYVCSDVSLTSVKGRVIQQEFNLPGGGTHTCQVVACIHPAAVLRSPEQQPKMDSALTLLAESLRGEVKQRPKDYRYIYNAEELGQVVAEIKALPSDSALAVDVEWQGRFPCDQPAYVRTVQLAWGLTKACAIFLHDEAGQGCFAEGVPAAVELLKPILEGRPEWQPRLVGHGLNADIPWLLALGIDVRNAFATDPVSPERTRVRGGFDTMLAAHAVCETDDFELEALCAKYFGWERYDAPLNKFLAQYCEERKLDRAELNGYGCVPDALIGEYGCDDASGTWNLELVLNGRPGLPGLLDEDPMGLESRTAFWHSMRGVLGFGEMHLQGLGADMERVEALVKGYGQAKVELLELLRKRLNWPEFNSSSTQHCRELLFGEAMNGKTDQLGNPVRLRPPEAIEPLGLTPYKTTGRRSKLWADAIERTPASALTPSTDKEALAVHAEQAPEIAGLLGDVRKARHIVQTILAPGEENEDKEIVYKKGTMAFVLPDGRIHSSFYQTKDSGRSSSARPPLQNWGKSIEKQYKAIFNRYKDELTVKYLYPIRSLVKARPGHVFVDGDWSGAELCMAAWKSKSKAMIAHCARMALPEDHPDHYDIHASTGVSFYKLQVEPRKRAMDKAGLGNYRNSAKVVNFGYMYGQSSDSLVRRARLDGVVMTHEDADGLAKSLETMYPELPVYFNECRRCARAERRVRNWAGRNRRFPVVPKGQDYNRVMGEFERIAMNAGIQGGVADAMHEALWHLYWHRFENYQPERWYYIVLGVHDQVLLECPIECVSWVVDEVMPECMSRRVDIWPTDPLGRSTNDPDAPYHLPLPPPDVCEYWGIPLDLAGCRRLGVPDKYAAI